MTLNRPHPVTDFASRERAPRQYEQIASRIIAMIRENGLSAGDRLPTERELTKLFETSRPSVREAMIALETFGLVEVRTGDGSFVKTPPDRVSTSRIEGLESNGPGPLEQFQARKVIEPTLAAMAAVRATGAEIDALETYVGEMAKVYPSLGNLSDRLGWSFHTELAAMSRNTILASVVRAMWDLRESPMWLHLRRHTITEENRALVVTDRRAIVLALRRRDPDGARAAMSSLLDRAGRRYFGGEW